MPSGDGPSWASEPLSAPTPDQYADELPAWARDPEPRPDGVEDPNLKALYDIGQQQSAAAQEPLDSTQTWTPVWDDDERDKPGSGAYPVSDFGSGAYPARPDAGSGAYPVSPDMGSGAYPVNPEGGSGAHALPGTDLGRGTNPLTGPGAAQPAQPGQPGQPGGPGADFGPGGPGAGADFGQPGPGAPGQPGGPGTDFGPGGPGAGAEFGQPGPGGPGQPGGPGADFAPGGPGQPGGPGGDFGQPGGPGADLGPGGPGSDFGQPGGPGADLGPGGPGALGAPGADLGGARNGLPADASPGTDAPGAPVPADPGRSPRTTDSWAFDSDTGTVHRARPVPDTAHTATFERPTGHRPPPSGWEDAQPVAFGNREAEAQAPAEPEDQARISPRWTFGDLVARAGIPEGEYAVEEEVDGAFCLVTADDGFDVFYSEHGGRHNLQHFDDEQAAFYYLFGRLSAVALRSGRLSPPR